MGQASISSVNCLGVLLLFHIHIPKTAGTSLNAMFAEAFGEEFQNHGLEHDKQIPEKSVIAAHRTYLQVIRMYPDSLLCAVAREPRDRLRSTIEHIHARRNKEAYSHVSGIVSELVDSQFSSVDRWLSNKTFLLNFDNLIVRYLTDTPVHNRVEQKHLNGALRNIKNIDFLSTVQDLKTCSEKMFTTLGAKPPNMQHINKQKIKSSLFEELPESLEKLIVFDDVLYSAIARSPAPKA